MHVIEYQTTARLGLVARRRLRGFTLIELMAVAVLIGLLSVISLGVYGYVQKKTAISTTRSQLSAMEEAIELYKADWGYYPATTPIRVSSSGAQEAVNNLLLYRALSGNCLNCSKRYMRFPQSQLRINLASGITNSAFNGLGQGVGTEGITNIFDVWGTPFNYYCSPKTPFSLMNNYYGYPTNVNDNNGCTMGGQVNVATFDLFSYGPDRMTFAGQGLSYGSWNDGPWVNRGFSYGSSAIDDITNFGR